MKSLGNRDCAPVESVSKPRPKELDLSNLRLSLSDGDIALFLVPEPALIGRPL
jgi:hypothetical protein